jgi:zinc protease
MKKLAFFSVLFLILVLISSCGKTKYQATKATDSNGYSYETVTNDPMGVRIYTLKNGLKVYFTVVKDAPRIQTLISVKAGSLIEPEQTTGLAHYFEHLMFKGTSQFGTSNWEKEKVLIGRISDLFEQRLATTDSIKKVKIFASIDSLSILASNYTIPNEYDKLMQVIGGQGTNAFTSYQGTSYIEDIPSNEIDRWLKLQQERFSNIALRLFHTELETVYEEFNMAQDQDRFKAYTALMTGLFPTHPLGRFVLGFPEHLKNPSMVNIHNFFNTYYVPNNMAIIMSGDFDMDKTILMIDKTFGQFKAKSFEKPVFPAEQPITKPVIKEVFGPDAEMVSIGFRFKGDSTQDKKYVALIDMILNNSAAGLIDLNLVQDQKILNGGCYPQFYVDYGVHQFWGNPREGQKLETVKDLLLGEIEKVKKGEFDDWLIKAVINDMRLQAIRNQEYYQNRAYILNDDFQINRSRMESIIFYDELDKITKDQLMQFASENYRDNYVVTYKRKGVDKNMVKVPKPKITPININRNDQSEFFTEFSKNKPGKINPVFVDFEKEMQKKELKPGIDLFYIPNKTNELFELCYIIDMGKANSKKLEQAVRYLPFVGTDKYTPAQLQQEFYKLGVRFNVYTGDERSYVYVSGLDKSFEPAAGLLEHLLTHAKADTSTYRKYIEGVLKERSNNKMNKDFILQVALANYGKYGKNSAFTDIIQEKEMRAQNPVELMSLVKDLGTYKQRILYYGKSDLNTAMATILKQHPLPDKPMDYSAATIYPEADFKANQVFFIDYDMVQTNFLLVGKTGMFSPQMLPYVNLYNDYYGYIVFQEIREARGLAYAAGTWIETPDKKDRSFFTTSFVATQADKLNEATSTLNSLMKNLKEDQRRYDLAKDAIMNRIETERITKTNIFWTYLNNMDKGITTDNRKDIYEKVQGISMADLKTFLENNKSKNYTLLVVGKNGSVDKNILKKLGNYKELSLQEVFNY